MSKSVGQVWKQLRRPGYFGRRRDQIVSDLNSTYGAGNWEVRWFDSDEAWGFMFQRACIAYYETAYLTWLRAHPEEVDFICSFGECIDNASTNITSGLDYAKQEAFSTHIQDIAVRNCLYRLGRKFGGSVDNILVIRSSDSNGHKYGPGNIPFHKPEAIEHPSLRPRWANAGSVEDFWQSNKWICVRMEE